MAIKIIERNQALNSVTPVRNLYELKQANSIVDALYRTGELKEADDGADFVCIQIQDHRSLKSIVDDLGIEGNKTIYPTQVTPTGQKIQSVRYISNLGLIHHVIDPDTGEPPNNAICSINLGPKKSGRT